MVLFVLSLHIVFLILWSASLLYFPQLVVRQATIDDPAAERDAAHMQRTLYALVMTPAAVLTVIAGSWLVFERGFSGGWLHVKLTLVLLMTFFHAYCGSLMDAFRHKRIRHRLWYFRLLPLAPGVLIVGVVTLAVGKPF
jgi:putative membrane protein